MDTSMTGVTLLDALKSTKRNVKVGAVNGSGYVYCGEPSAIKLHEADAMCAEAERRKIEQARKRLKSLILEMAELQRRIDRATTDLYSKQDYYNSRTHLLKRRVSEVCKSIDEPNTLLIKFEGDEKGPFWTTEECKNNKMYIDED